MSEAGIAQVAIATMVGIIGWLSKNKLDGIQKSIDTLVSLNDKMVTEVFKLHRKNQLTHEEHLRLVEFLRGKKCFPDGAVSCKQIDDDDSLDRVAWAELVSGNVSVDSTEILELIRGSNPAAVLARAKERTRNANA